MLSVRREYARAGLEAPCGKVSVTAVTAPRAKPQILITHVLPSSYSPFLPLFSATACVKPAHSCCVLAGEMALVADATPPPPVAFNPIKVEPFSPTRGVFARASLRKCSVSAN